MLLKPNGSPAGHTRTYGHSGQGVFLRIGGDGNLIIYKPVPGPDQALWSRVKNDFHIFS